MLSRALIIKFGAIGDVVMALPAAHALHLRGAEIHWVCGPAVAPLLRCYPWIQPIVVDDRTLLAGSFLGRAAAVAGLWRRLASTRYGLCATLYYDARYRILALPVRSGRKLMLSWNDRQFRLNRGRPYADEYARILLDEEDTCRPVSLPPVRPDRLPPSPLPPKGPLPRIALVPGGASNMLRQQTLRRWPVASYIRLTQTLLSRGYEVVLLGGPEDAWVRSDLHAQVGPALSSPRLIDSIGTLTLPEVVAACDSCDVVVSHDTGPLHLAALSTAAILALFGPTDPGNFLPRRPGVRALWGGEGFACRPCYDGASFAPCKDNGCMQQISTGMVLAHIDDLLEQRRSGALEAAEVVLPSGARAAGVAS